MPVTIAITADKGIPKSKLEQLALQTSLSLLTPKTHVDYLLHLTTEHLELRKILPSDKGKKQKVESITIDFLAGKSKHRRLQGGGKGQDLAKAIGLHKIKNPTVLDLTAGMGGDSFVLATLGASLSMVERNPVVHALLNDALERISLSADSELQEILSRIKLINSDSFEALKNVNEELPDVIYLDPMFPPRTKSAQVKKEMQFFHDIVGDDNDSEKLLLESLQYAKKRIVVKRPRLAEKLTEVLQADFVITGKTTRYDIYLPKKRK